MSSQILRSVPEPLLSGQSTSPSFQNVVRGTARRSPHLPILASRSLLHFARLPMNGLVVRRQTWLLLNITFAGDTKWVTTGIISLFEACPRYPTSRSYLWRMPSPALLSTNPRYFECWQTCRQDSIPFPARAVQGTVGNFSYLPIGQP
jgi:hypothetical protein